VIAGHKAEKDWVTIPGASSPTPRSRAPASPPTRPWRRAIEVVVGKFPFAALGKAMAMMETDGFVKVVADKKTKQVLGVHIVGPEASTMISEGALALEMAAFLDDLALTIHPHPTLGEALMEASAHALGHAIHIANR
jgi:dihydrolipoamide dehydrogenase